MRENRPAGESERLDAPNCGERRTSRLEAGGDTVGRIMAREHRVIRGIAEDEVTPFCIYGKTMTDVIEPQCLNG